MLSYACLRPLTSTAKRCWLPLLGLLGIIYLGFGIVNYDPVIPQSPPPHELSSAKPFMFVGTKTSRVYFQVFQTSPVPPAYGRYGGAPQRVPKQEPHPTITKQTTPQDVSQREPHQTTRKPAPQPVSKRELHQTTTEPTTISQNFSLNWKPFEQLLKRYDQVPFPLENVTALPTATKVVAQCANNLDYLFFVHTASTHTNHRRILRESVGNPSLGARYNWSMVFFVGLSPIDKVSQGVVSEAQTYGDIVVLPFLDTYRNLTYKFVYGIKWTVENCPNVRFILKMDDDIVIHMPTIIKKFAKTPELAAAAPGPKIHCCVWDNMPVIRQTALPWYLSEQTYPKKVFPRYCSGSAVFIDASAFPSLYNASFSVPYIPVDDAYVTGELAAVANISHEPLNNLYSFDTNRWTAVGNGSLLVVQVSNADLRVKAWKIVLKALTDISATPTSTTSPTTQTVSPSGKPLSRLTPATAAVTERTATTVRAMNVSVTVSSTQITQMHLDNSSRTS